LMMYLATKVGVTFHNPNNSDNRQIDYWAVYSFRNGFILGASIQVPNDRTNNDIFLKALLCYSFSYKESQILSPLYFF